MKKEKKKSLDKDTKNRDSKKSLKETPVKKFELVNFLSGTGDSISATPIGNLHSGELYYAENLVRERIREIIRQELVAAGVLMKPEE